MGDIGTGLAAQLGFAKESTYGTFVAPTDFLEFVNESLSASEERIESSAVGAHRRVLRSNRWAQGARSVEGSVEHEFLTKGMGPLLEVAMGGASFDDTDPDAVIHTFTPGPLKDKSLSVQVGRVAIDGTIHPFSYTGCQVTEFSLGATVGEILSLSMNYNGKDEDLTQTLADPTFPDDDDLFVYHHGSLTIDGVDTSVSAFNLSGNNSLAVERRGFARTRRVGLETGLRGYTGDFDAEFDDLTLYNLYRDGAEAALVLEFDGPGTTSLKVTANVRVDGETPNVGGPDEIRQPIGFKCIEDPAGTGPESALSIEYVTDSVEI